MNKLLKLMKEIKIDSIEIKRSINAIDLTYFFEDYNKIPFSITEFEWDSEVYKKLLEIDTLLLGKRT